jgi:hypothetical protein
MSAGDEVGLTEDLYITMIGRYAAAVEVLTKRIVLKDQYINQLENEKTNPVDTTPPEAAVAP